jgi:streptogramin lyase
MGLGGTVLCILLTVLLIGASGSEGATTAQSRRLGLGGVPLHVLSAHGLLWLLTCDRGCSGEAKRSVGRVIEIDPRTNKVIGSVQLAHPGAIAVGSVGIYVTDFERGSVRRLDPRTLRLTKTLHLKLPFSIVTSTYRSNAFLPEAVVVGDGSVWVATDRGALARADPRLRQLTGMLRLPQEAFQTVATAPGAVWLSESLLGLYRVNSRTNRVVARIPIGPAHGRLAVGQLIPAGKRLLALGEWTSGGTLTGRNGLARLNTTRNRVQGITPLPAGQLASAYGAGSLWLGRVDGSLLERIDPASGRILQRLPARLGVQLAVADGHVWTVTRGGALRRLAST